MRATKLILLEGLPGSGKSTAAQFLTRQLAHRQIPVTWWYEEVRDHPLYPFDDAASLRRVVDDLFTGNHRAVVATVLAKWQAFAAALASSDGIVVLDGCLFGYLTWSLFPADVPEPAIAAYVAQVKEIIEPLNPSLIYLYQHDLARALRTICDRRGSNTEQAFIARATGNPYAVRRGLDGFDGLVRYWTDYRTVLDRLFARLTFPKLAIENSARHWPAYEARMLAFLGLPPALPPPAPPPDLWRFTGTYHATQDGDPVRCQVSLDGDSLTIDGLPHLWPHTRLVPEGEATFAVESLPFQVSFHQHEPDGPIRMQITGPPLLAGSVDAVLVRGAARA